MDELQVDESVRPSLLFLITCDAVGHGPDRKKTLYGVFDHILAREFPCVHPQMSVVTKWGHGIGTHEMRLQIATSDGQPIFQTPQPLKFQMSDPLTSVDLVINIQNLRIPRPGVYYVRVQLDGQWEETEQTLVVSRIDEGARE